MTQPRNPLYLSRLSPPLGQSLRLLLVAGSLALAGCVYRPDIQQGNLLEEEAVEQVVVGMPQSAVEFLLGTPMIADPFHADRWDYSFYLKRGRSRDVERSWVVVYFEDGRVSRIERELTLEPTS